MKNNIDTQRHSSSSPQEQAEPRLEAGEGLDVTACSASLFVGMTLDEKKAMWTNLTMELGKNENRFQCDDLARLAYDFKWLIWDKWTTEQLQALGRFD